MRLNLGCGNDVRDGWVNIDSHERPGVLVADLADPNLSLPFPDDHFTEIEASHLIEHIAVPLPLLAELHRVAANGCKLTFRCPHGGSDDAWEDPTHVRAYFPGSFLAFSQPYYWRVSNNGNGYGYAGDWQPVKVTLNLHDWAKQARDKNTVVFTCRNAVAEMVAELRAVKPARPARRDLMNPGQIIFV